MSNSKSIIPLEDNEFKARTLDELKHVVESFFANKGSKPIIIAEDNSVMLIMEDAVYEKAVSDFQQASDLCNRGKFSQAKPILDTIIKECPSFSEAYRLKAQIAKMEGNIDKAVDVNLDALCCDPNNNWALVLMGNLLMEKEDYDGAKGYFERVIKNDARNALALSNAGMCLIKQERSVESLDYFERALQQDETYANVYYGYALAYSMLEQYDRAFEMARVGMIKSVDKPENPGAKKQLQQLFIHIAQACVSVYDYSKILKDYQNQIQHKTSYPIEFVQDESIKVDAQVRIAQQHNAKRHVVVYRNKNKYKVHLVMHELTHLSMALDAMNNGRLKNVMSGQTQYRTFSNHYEVFFQKLKKRIGEADAESVLRQLYDGLVLLIMNAPLDLFVEDTLFEVESLRPMQMLSLLALEEKSIEGDAKGDEIFPLDLVNNVRTLNCVTSLHLKTLYGIDMVNRHNPSKSVLKTAQDLLEEYEAYREDYSPGDEYELMNYFADAIECNNLFMLEDYIDLVGTHSAEIKPEQQEQFDSTHGEEKNPVVDMMMSMYMLEALRFFNSRLPIVAQQAATQIAMIGTGGISPAKNRDIKSLQFRTKILVDTGFLLITM